MTSALFQQIEQQVNETLDREEANPTVGDPPAHLVRDATENPMYVAGIPIPAETRVTQWREQRPGDVRAQIVILRMSCKELSAMLGTCGITPLAIIPLATWDQIRVACKLYQFWPNKDGAVRVADKDVLNIRQESPEKVRIAWSHWRRCLIGSACVSLLAALLSAFWIQWWAIAVAVGGFLIAALVFLPPFLDSHERVRVRIQAFLGRHDHANQLATLFPGFSESVLYIPFYFGSLKLTFPPAPQNVLDVLLKLETWRAMYPYDGNLMSADDRIRTAAPAEAIRFGQDLGEFLLSPHAPPVPPLEDDVSGCADTDPILLVRHGSAIAIVAQYGDLRLEQEALERALNVLPLV